MIIRNIEDTLADRRSLHEGLGVCDNRELYTAGDFQSPLRFLVHTVVPPGATIGYHPHGQDEEMYVILSGRAIMTVNGERREVRAGDAILNKPGWSHGLENPFAEPVCLLVYLARLT